MLADITKAFINLEEKKVMKLIEYAIRKKYPLTQIVDAIQSGLDEIGMLFEEGKYGVTDLMMAGLIYEELLKTDYFLSSLNISEEKTGSILICTIKNDVHDIGKSIFKCMAIMVGLDVIDIGVDVSPEIIVRKAKECKPDIIGISSILTGGIEYIKKTNALLLENKLRENVKIIIGGLSTYSEAVRYCGVDAYAKNAFEGSKICNDWLQKKGCNSDRA